MASPGESEPESQGTSASSDTSPSVTTTSSSEPVPRVPRIHLSSQYCATTTARLYTSPLDNSDLAYYIGLALVTLASIATRLYKIEEPYHVA